MQAWLLTGFQTGFSASLTLRPGAPTSKGNFLEGVLFSSEAWGYIWHAMSSTEDHVWLSATESVTFNREIGDTAQTTQFTSRLE